MTKEDIEKAAVDSCVFENSIFNPELTPYYEQGFKDGANWRINSVWHDANEMPGANWRINSVWHDANEMPDLGEAIIVELFGKVWDYGTYDVSDSIHPKAKWAYMNDLIPSKED